jgi:hypothetical protein
MQHHSPRQRASRRRPSSRRGFKILVFIALALPIAALAALWMAFDDEPHVMYEGDLSQKSYEKAQEFIEAHDPRNVGEGGVQTLVASEDEVNLVVNYAARRFHQAAARIALQPGAAVVRASVPVPSSPFGPWLNVQAVVRESPGLPVVDKLKLGAVRVPSFLADYALERVLERYGASEQGRVAKDMVKHVAFTDTQVKVVYEWRQDLVKRALSTLTSADDQERFRAYSARLFQTVEGSRRRSSMSLADLMTPLFRLAQQRSAEGNAAKENRAAIITLAFFATDRSLSTLIPAAATWPAPVPVQVTLGGRDDLAQHFLVSAALAMEGGSALSNAIGVHKEVNDAKRFDRDREGFSFQDLAADKAGARFGTLAIKSPQKMQRGIAAGVKEADFMPPHKDLAENIPEPEFRKRYGGVGAPAYNNVVADIETRVARAPLLR